LKTPDVRDVELNELRWWSRWARLRRHGDGYLLSSGAFREPFFNRGGSLSCGGMAGAAAWAEGVLSPSGTGCTLFVLDSCSAAKKLAASGYRRVDVQSVLFSKGQVGKGGREQEIAATTHPEAWTAAYLRSFYGDEDLAGVVDPIVVSLMKTKAATLLESRAGGKTVGVLALYRTPGLVGAYCVGTVPEHRREGVATGLLAEARRIADGERRTLILQTLASDGALQFYLRRGFGLMYSKLVLEKAHSGTTGAASKVKLGVSIDRKAPAGIRPFKSVFGGFERVRAVRSIFGSETDEVLTGLPVEITGKGGYMKIDDQRGSIVVNEKYLREGNEVDIYLDVVHELVHIRQHREGKELWDRRYEYVDRPTEIEAYRVAVKEARRLGMDEGQVAQYLKVEWISEDAFRRFLGNLGVKKV
jgi:GNAT superfamily N-acetyltransferase